LPGRLIIFTSHLEHMIIGKYIRMLLDERVRVILPGFGNLEVKFPERAKAPSGNRIDPPGISVRFDAGFSKDDGELARKLAAGEGLEGEEANQRVLELVDAIKFALDKGEDYTLPEAGTFLKDENGKIRFHADPAWVLAPDLYGLESMDLLELEELQEGDEPGEQAEPVSRKDPKITPLATPAPKQKASGWRVIWLVAMVLIVILAVLILIPSPENENEKGLKQFFKKKPDREVVQQDEDATNQQGGESAGQDVETETGTEIPEVNVDQSAPVEENNKFFIIAGSFKNLRNASDMQDKLNERGFQAEVMITENRMYRVSVASFATKEEAEKELVQISSEPGLQSCWLLSN
jgi:hypothetical protein